MSDKLKKLETLRKTMDEAYDVYNKARRIYEKAEQEAKTEIGMKVKEEFMKKYIEPLNKSIEGTYWIKEGSQGGVVSFILYRITAIPNLEEVRDSYEGAVRNSPGTVNESFLYNACGFYTHMPRYIGLRVYYDSEYGELKSKRAHFDSGDAIFWPNFVNDYKQLTKEEYQEKLNLVLIETNNL